MDFRVSFADLDHEEGYCRVVIAAGGVEVRSYPQAFSDHFRDLHANRYFLARKVLASFFFGDEPLMNLDYADNDVVIGHVFRGRGWQRKKLSGEFSIGEALSHIDRALGEISASLGSRDEELLLEQFGRDLALGVYDVYLKTPDR